MLTVKVLQTFMKNVRCLWRQTKATGLKSSVNWFYQGVLLKACSNLYLMDGALYFLPHAILFLVLCLLPVVATINYRFQTSFFFLDVN